MWSSDILTDMPSIDENERMWNRDYDWSQGGAEWSEWWGTTDSQWFGCLLPRVFPFLNGRILEIGPGRGRWTQFLQAHCTSLIGIDLAQSCVERCEERFGHLPNIEFNLNDGLTFPMVESGSIDFAFSFDSLVHAESDVISSYVLELARVLKPGAVAFLHHSNLGAVLRRRSVFDRIRRRIAGVPFDLHWRAPSMSAEKMRTFVEGAGMSCVQQEMVPWGTGWALMIDCMSTICNTPGHQCYVFRNARFREEATTIKRISTLCSRRAIENGAVVHP